MRGKKSGGFFQEETVAREPGGLQESGCAFSGLTNQHLLAALPANSPPASDLDDHGWRMGKNKKAPGSTQGKARE